MIARLPERRRGRDHAVRGPRRQVHGRRGARLFRLAEAHEDDAERAVRAGLAVIGAVGALPTPAGEPLAARIGIATGLVVVGDLIGEGAAQEQAVVGDTPNLAARLQALAEPGMVVIADATRRLLGDSVRAWRPRAADAQGHRRTDPRLRACSASGRSRAASRRGRRAASRRSSAATRSWPCCSSAGGRPRAVKARWSCSRGEAGIGKSRITEALVERCGRASRTSCCATSARPTTPTPRSTR